MAAARIIRRNSYEQLQAMDHDESGLTYACDCGQEYMDEERLQRHQQTNCKNRSIKCSFCQENCSSSAALRDHLLLCGNKTDQCPKCRQFIRRSHFVYHFENDCASVDEVDTPPSRSRNSSVNRYPPNSNRPVSREDVANDDGQENYPGRNSPMYPPRINGRVQSPIVNARNSPGIIECEYCHNRCAQSEYKTHKDNCLRNPANNMNRQSPRIPLRSNQNQARSPVNAHGAQNGIVHIPCEICKEPVDLPNWSNHTQNCREKEARRLAMRARSMSQEPVREQLPCEYCQELYPANRLHSHQTNCMNNPANRVPAVEVARSRTPHFQLPRKISDNGRSDPPSANTRSLQNLRLAQYQSIDVDRTHAANRQRDNNELVNDLDHSPRGSRRYGNIPVRPNDHRPNEHMPQANNQGGRRPVPPRPRSPIAAPSRLTSSLDDLQDNRADHNSNNGGVVYRPSHPNSSKYQPRRYDEPDRLIVIDNQPDRLITKKNKKKPSKLKQFFCGADFDYAAD